MTRAKNALLEIQRRYDEMTARSSSSMAENANTAERPLISPTVNQYCSPTITRVRPASTSVRTTIRKPPKFDIERFASYKGELELRRDSHALIDDPLPIAEITLHAGNPLRMALLQYMKSTKGNKESRTFEAIIKVLDTEFQRDSHERALMKMQQFQPFKRVRGEDIFFVLD